MINSDYDDVETFDATPNGRVHLVRIVLLRGMFLVCLWMWLSHLVSCATPVAPCNVKSQEEITVKPDVSVYPDDSENVTEPVPEKNPVEPRWESEPQSESESQPESVCTNGATRPCYSVGKVGCTTDTTGKYKCKGSCTTGTEACVNGTWSRQCNDATEPTTEVCNDKDDDCDGEIDNQCGFFWAVSTGSTGEDRGNSIAIDSSDL